MMAICNGAVSAKAMRRDCFGRNTSHATRSSAISVYAADAGDRDGDARPEVQNDRHRSNEADPDDRLQHGVARAEPQQRRREPETLPAGVDAHLLEVRAHREEAARADEPFDLEIERVER